MSVLKGSNWLQNAIGSQGYLRINPGCEVSFYQVKDAIEKPGPNYTHDRLVAKLPFGFWRYHFAPKGYNASGKLLINIFGSRPRGIAHINIFHRLTKINEIRNRIAHHEPICFQGNRISTAIIENRYNTILKLLEWLGCNPHRILYGIDGVRQSISAINNI